MDCFASLGMTGRAQFVSSIVVGRRLSRHSPDERRLRSEARRSSLVIAMASYRPEVDVEIAEVPVYRVSPYCTHLGPAATIAGRTANEQSGGSRPFVASEASSSQALPTLHQIDAGNNHDDQTTEQDQPHAIRGFAVGVDCLD